MTSIKEEKLISLLNMEKNIYLEEDEILLEIILLNQKNIEEKLKIINKVINGTVHLLPIKDFKYNTKIDITILKIKAHIKVPEIEMFDVELTVNDLPITITAGNDFTMTWNSGGIVSLNN